MLRLSTPIPLPPLIRTRKQAPAEFARQAALFDAMQQHLCRTLAHYLVFLASHLGLQLSTNAERSALDAMPLEWNAVLSAHVMHSSKYVSLPETPLVGRDCTTRRVDPEWLRSQLDGKPLASHDNVTGNLEHLLESLSETRRSQTGATVGTSLDYGGRVSLG